MNKLERGIAGLLAHKITLPVILGFSLNPIHINKILSAWLSHMVSYAGGLQSQMTLFHRSCCENGICSQSETLRVLNLRAYVSIRGAKLHSDSHARWWSA